MRGYARTMALWLLSSLLASPAASAAVGAYCAACSFNGRCGPGGTCECDAAWVGASCATLNLLPSSKELGYQGLAGGQNVTSWGGSVVFGADGKYHMYAAEITENWCAPQRLLARRPSEPPVAVCLSRADRGRCGSIALTVHGWRAVE